MSVELAARTCVVPLLSLAIGTASCSRAEDLPEQASAVVLGQFNVDVTHPEYLGACELRFETLHGVAVAWERPGFVEVEFRLRQMNGLSMWWSGSEPHLRPILFDASFRGERPEELSLPLRMIGSRVYWNEERVAEHHGQQMVAVAAGDIARWTGQAELPRVHWPAGEPCPLERPVLDAWTFHSWLVVPFDQDCGTAQPPRWREVEFEVHWDAQLGLSIHWPDG